MAKKVIVYTAEWCTWCHKVVEFLKENNVEFEEKNVADQAKAKEAIEKSGQAGIPVVDIDGEIVVGFNEKKLKELLGL
jgi:glutaredoxin-like YruB-family protein